MRDYLPAELIAVWLGVSKRTVQRWARDDGWRTRGTWQDVEYHVEDAAESMATRRGVAVL